MPQSIRSIALTCFAVLALAASTLAAHADTMEDFTVNINVDPGITVTGTVDVDFTSDTFTTGDLTYSDSNDGTNVTFNERVLGVGQTNSPATINFVFENSSANELDIVLPVSSVSDLSSYSGIVCTGFDYSTCGSYVTYVKIDNSPTSALGGTFDPSVTPAPEPSSLLLLGTGLLGMVGAVRRKRGTIQ